MVYKELYMFSVSSLISLNMCKSPNLISKAKVKDTFTTLPSFPMVLLLLLE